MEMDMINASLQASTTSMVNTIPEIKDLITSLCKSDYFNKINKENVAVKKSITKTTIKRLMQILHREKLRSTDTAMKSSIEIKRDKNCVNVVNKFFNVVIDRESCANERAEITACNPNAIHISSDFEASNATMTNSNVGVNISPMHKTHSATLLTKSTLHMNTTNSIETNNGESIVSTCEEHMTSRLEQVTQFKRMPKPKSTSSTTSLLKHLTKAKKKSLERIDENRIGLEKPRKSKRANGSMTFNVDFASTPKKVIPRSSTPKRLTNTAVKKSTSNSHNHVKKTRITPFSSTVLSIKQKLIQTNQVAAKKTIPPPLLSSSLNTNNNSAIYLIDKKSRKVKSIKGSKGQVCSFTDNFSIIKNEKLVVKTSKKLQIKKNQHFQLLPSNNCRKCERENLRRKMSSNNKKECCKYVNGRVYKTSSSAKNVKSSTLSIEKGKCKYPIKYYPHIKSQDIDRLNLADDCATINSYECNLKPVLKSCYSYGDYNVWIL